MASIEKRLGILAGDEEGTRVVFVQVCEPGELPTLEMRHEVEAGRLGWVVQKRIRLAAGQIGALAGALSMMDIDAREATCAASVSARARGIRLIG